ncbi:MAG: hydroxymethylglutaryl-CoA lyase [Bdellovibrionales bacterium]
MSQIKILEVGPRDGLQNEKKILSLEDKLEFIKKLSLVGLEKIEVGSFVSSKVIPQMKDTQQLVENLFKLQAQKEIPEDTQFTALVPNQKGLENAIASGLKEVALFLACTDGFSKKNINCSVEESLKIYKAVAKEALKQNLKVRAYLSVCFVCPYEGEVSPQRVLEILEVIKTFNVYEISISDTLGVATPQKVQALLNVISKKIELNQLAFHFHNVHGMALANIWTAYQMGIRSFDGSVGGLGGCPYAKIETGNVPTESLFYLLEGSQSPYIKGLVDIAKWLETKLEKKLSSVLVHSPYYK